jgi:hypothetical protein
VDCSPLGDRFCDIASPGGYCIIEGCDQKSCPGEAVCVRFFTLQRRAACTCRDGQPVCRSAECPGQGEVCATGFCASETSERRWCMKGCDGDGDCREGYRCAQTGENGAALVPYEGQPPGEQAQFCAPALKGS